MGKHTPGPWEVFKAGTFWGVDAGRKSIVIWGDANEETGVQGQTVEQSQANAYLIAAAPDLLEACQGAMRIVSLWNGREVPEDHEHAEEMKALYMMQQVFIEAIAKAEGKSK